MKGLSSASSSRTFFVDMVAALGRTLRPMPYGKSIRASKRASSTAAENNFPKLRHHAPKAFNVCKNLLARRTHHLPEVFVK
ncbi:hypothetical protein F2981_22225 (plasmid) [Sinorhizobium meliloti]|nr:hypothetical protein [Sinorhizobium meliloti]